MTKQTKKRAKVIRPPNTLQDKVGTGGISDNILDKAQALLETNAEEFAPIADIYLVRMLIGIQKAETDISFESALTHILQPCMHLKANGGMFYYHLITTIADKLARFLGSLTEFDDDAIEIITAFHTTMRAVIVGKIKGDGGKHGASLLGALDEACERYIKHK